MIPCEYSDQCSFFDIHMSGRPTTAKIYKDLFCDLNPRKCARHIAADQLGQDNVPNDLYPHMSHRFK